MRDTTQNFLKKLNRYSLYHGLRLPPLAWALLCDERNGSKGANIVWFYRQQRPMNRHSGSAALCHKKTPSVTLPQAYQIKGQS